ncbi:MAG TPA: hypothetical protein VEX86_11115, partial [Longimicrobium sp.]|nr:hypothetical protein [Longimicrobium sp.]
MDRHDSADARSASSMKRLPRLLVLLGAAFVLGACAGDLPTGGGRAAVPHGPARTFDLNPACETTGQVHTGGADSAITTTQHWYPEGNPHLVHGVILVENGAQLRIHAGTVVCFNGGGIEARNGG